MNGVQDRAASRAPEAESRRPRPAARTRRRPPREGRGRPGRWWRAWLLAVALLVLVPLLALLPPVQRLLFPLRYGPELQVAARQAGVDPHLVAAVVYSESGFRSEVVSDAGAVGLMQLMPATADWAAEQSGSPRPVDLRQPAQNLRLGAWYLAWLLERFEGNEVLALAAYNGGQHTVDEWRRSGGPSLEVEQLPYPETRHFVQKVLRAQERYRRLYPELG